MKALLLKDYYMLVSKKARVLLVFLLTLSLLPISMEPLICMVYAATIPPFLISLEDRTHWNRLSTMLPYTALDVVLCKFLMGYLLMGISVVCNLLSFSLWGIHWGDYASVSAFTWQILLPGVCFAWLLLGISMPLQFWLGSEKGQWAIGFVMIVGFLVIFCFIKDPIATISQLRPLLGWLLAAGGILQFLSILLSVFLLRRRQL